MPTKKPQTDDHWRWVAQGPDGCHADTEEVLAACRRLEAAGVVFEGPYKNTDGNPVFFAHSPGQYTPEDPLRAVHPGVMDYQPMPGSRRVRG